MNDFSERLKQFIAGSEWVFAKTYAETWPHEYIVQERVDNDLFIQLAAHIDTHGYESEFYSTRQIYFDFNGDTYWHMDCYAPLLPEEGWPRLVDGVVGAAAPNPKPTAAAKPKADCLKV